MCFAHAGTPKEGGREVTDRQAAEAAVLDVLLEANVQFVAVGEPGDRPALRLVVSRHPTNLHALGALLERLEASLRTTGAPGRSAEPAPAVFGTDTGAGSDTSAGSGAGVRRVGDPLATLSVKALGVDVELLFGGPHRSLYAKTLAVATDREIFGRLVKWAPAPPDVTSSARGTGTALGRRLLSIAEGLAHLVEREAGPPPRPHEEPPSGKAPREVGEPGAGTDLPGVGGSQN